MENQSDIIPVGIIMNGVTGRMGKNQHLMRSIVPIVREGGISIAGNRKVMPRPVLVGRNKEKLKQLSRESGIEEWSTDLESLLSGNEYQVYFDAQPTDMRYAALKKAISAGKHIYCEKPVAMSSGQAVELHRLAEEAGIKHGVVADKLWLPGLIKLKLLIDQGFFGRILSVKADFGYWVFEGDTVPPQRPAWNYRSEEGGGIILDMFCHWRYVIDNLFGDVRFLTCLGANHIKERFEEPGKPYSATADDAAYAIFELDNGIIVQINSSWVTRVRRDDLFTMQVDGTKGSAVAGLREVWIQSASATPRPVWNPDVENPFNFRDDWTLMPSYQVYDNAFRLQWELFLRHVADEGPFRWDLMEAAKGVQLAGLAMGSWEKRAWVEVPELK